MTPPKRYTCRARTRLAACCGCDSLLPSHSPTWQARGWGQRTHLSLGAAGVLQHDLGEAAVALHHLHVVLYVWPPPHTAQVSATARPRRQAPAQAPARPGLQDPHQTLTPALTARSRRQARAAGRRASGRSRPRRGRRRHAGAPGSAAACRSSPESGQHSTANTVALQHGQLCTALGA